MMAFGFMETLLVLLTSGGGGNDLLDYMPTEAYWKIKGVEVSVERMAAELTTEKPANLDELVADLGAADYATREAATTKLRALGPAALPALKKAAQSDDPEVRSRAQTLIQAASASAGRQAKAVRRLMAIRTLGQLGKPEALAALRPLLASKEPFVADYARQAIAALEGKPYERPRPTQAQLWKDLCLLPPGCGIVAQISTAGGGGPVDFTKALEGMAGKLPPGQDPAMMVSQLAQMLAKAAEAVGNVRLDAVTVGVAGDIGVNQGFAVVVTRGLYDPAAVKALAQQQNAPVRQVGGFDVLVPEDEMPLMLCSPERLIVGAAPRRAALPLEDLAAAVKKDSDQPRLAPEMLALIKAMDTSAPAWAAIRLTPTYHEVPLFAPFETATVTAKPDGEGHVAVRLVARGKQAEAVKASVDEFNTGLEKAKAESAQAAARMPFIRPMADFVATVKIEQQDAAVTITGKLKGGANAVALPAIMFFSARAASMEARPAPGVEGKAIPAPMPR